MHTVNVFKKPEELKEFYDQHESVHYLKYPGDNVIACHVAIHGVSPKWISIRDMVITPEMFDYLFSSYKQDIHYLALKTSENNDAIRANLSKYPNIKNVYFS